MASAFHRPDDARHLAVCGVYGLFGMSGTIPNLLTVGSHGMAQSWTKTLA